LWLFAHNIQLEDESDNVLIGRQLHELSYKRDSEKMIDNLIAIDFIRKNKDVYEIHEVKKTNKMEKAHKYQLMYYMYYLKKEKDFENIIGILNYPTIRKTEKIKLTEENEIKIAEIIKEINNIIESKKPKAKKTKICYKCAYYEFCFI